jgi:hypothetical protein
VQAIAERHLPDVLAFAARVGATNGFREGA